MIKDENVLCFPGFRLDEIRGRWQGLETSRIVLSELFDNSKTSFSFRPRSAVEDDPSFKQLITYSIIPNYNSGHIFSYLRGSSGGEDRLKRLRSIGIGGHVSDLNMTSFDFNSGIRSREFTYCRQEAIREIIEEVSLEYDNLSMFRFLGLINDEVNPVGRVHLGLVYQMAIDSPVIPREACLEDAKMLSVHELKESIDDYEPWSQFLISCL